MAMVLFFETYSIIQTLLLWRHIKKARLIYFHKKGFPESVFNPRVKKNVERLIYLFNKKVEIKTIPVEKVYQYNWELNKDSLHFVEELAPHIERSSAYQVVLKVIRDENILKYYKARLAYDIPDRRLFMKVAKDLSLEHDSFAVVPASSDNSFLEGELFGREELQKWYIPAVHRINRIRRVSRKVATLVILSLLPIGFILTQLNKLTSKKTNKKNYDLAMPVMTGFHEGERMIRGVRRPHDDEYLYNKEMTIGRIIHIFGYWRFTPEVEAKYKQVMDKKGIPYVDRRHYKVNMGFLLLAGKIQFKIITGLLRNAFCRRDPPDYIYYSIGVIYAMLRKLVEFENVDYKVEIMRHDYDAAHIVGTILCHQHGKKTVGIQHNATIGPYALNSLCYVHMDKYCIFSDAHLNLYSPYWDDLHLEKIGSPWLDYVIPLVSNEQQLSSTRNRIYSLYGKRKYVVLITFPSSAEYCLVNKWDEMYHALNDLKSYDIDCHIFLRFRTIEDLEAKHISRFAQLPKRDDRIIIDLTNFTTYELMAVCDLYITSSHSTGLIEAVALRKKAFTFDYMGTAKYCFSKYGKDLILTTKDEVLNLFKNLENNFAGYDYNWELLRKEYNYHYDGRCLERLQKVVWEIVEEVSTGKR